MRVLDWIVLGCVAAVADCWGFSGGWGLVLGTWWFGVGLSLVVWVFRCFH